MIPFYGMFNICIGLLFVAIVPFMYKTAKQNFLDKELTGAYSVSFAIILSLVIGVYFIINAISLYLGSLAITDPTLALQFVQDSAYRAAIFPYPIGSYLLFAVLFFVTMIMVYIYMVNRDEQKSGEKVQEEIIISETDAEQRTTLSIDLELSRKVFHIALMGVIVCYIIIGELVTTGIFDHLVELYSADRFIDNFIPYSDLNMADYLPWIGQTWVLYAFMIVFFLAILTDIVRLYNPKYNPLKAVMKSWRDTERRTFAPHVFICLGCLIPVIFFKPPIAAAAIGIAALGDASATIVGITRGKHKIRPTSKKTWEGCIAGFAGAFIFGLLCYLAVISLAGVYGFTYNGTVIGGVVICLVGAVTFLFLDYWSPAISDNMLNPVFCGITMFLMSLVII